jgi:hypothetical protein
VALLILKNVPWFVKFQSANTKSLVLVFVKFTVRGACPVVGTAAKSATGCTGARTVSGKWTKLAVPGDVGVQRRAVELETRVEYDRIARTVRIEQEHAVGREVPATAGDDHHVPGRIEAWPGERRPRQLHGHLRRRALAGRYP